MAKRYILLDRDGTLIVERDYLRDPALVDLLPGAAEGLRLMVEMGFGLALVTNQSGIGRGLFGPLELERVHARLIELLAQMGLTLGGIYVCPHAPDDGCDCRKPRPGLVRQAATELHFDPHQCIVIGDKKSDLELGRRVGAKCVLVTTGYGAQTAAGDVPADAVVSDLAAAARAIAAHGF